jgi:hypothetical protein
MHDYDVITKRAVFRNVDTRPCSCNDVNACNVTSPVGNSKVVQKACSVTVDFEATVNPFFLVHLSGRYVVCWLCGRTRQLYVTTHRALLNTTAPYCCCCFASLWHNSWGRERYVCETKLTHGKISVDSMRGVSGHVHNPFAGNGLCEQCVYTPALAVPFLTQLGASLSTSLCTDVRPHRSGLHRPP